MWGLVAPNVVADSPDALDVAFNVLLDMIYNLGFKVKVSLNNVNTNFLGENSNVSADNVDNTNSANKTPDNASVAKTINNQLNGSNFNYL